MRWQASNYRGSVTFGRSFREGFWGGAGGPEIRDVEAAVGWLRNRGLADPKSTFITGPSYGGHFSLLSVGRLPDSFAGALAVVAMADWGSAWDEMNPALRKTWRSFMSLTPEGTFDDTRIEQTLQSMSSINYVDHVTASVWLYQGGRDTRTPPEQARNYSERRGRLTATFSPSGSTPATSRPARREHYSRPHACWRSSKHALPARRGTPSSGTDQETDMLTPHALEREGVALAAWSGGHGDTVVLLHGYPQNSLMWRHVIPSLLGSHHVVVMDLRGYGSSAAPAPMRGR